MINNALTCGPLCQQPVAVLCGRLYVFIVSIIITLPSWWLCVVCIYWGSICSFWWLVVYWSIILWALVDLWPNAVYVQIVLEIMFLQCVCVWVTCRNSSYKKSNWNVDKLLWCSLLFDEIVLREQVLNFEFDSQK